jgi:hypothetical protein
MQSNADLEELNACHCLFLHALRLVIKERRRSRVPITIEVAGQSMREVTLLKSM